MVSSDEDDIDDSAQTHRDGNAGDSSVDDSPENNSSQSAIQRAASKNETRSRRLKLKAMSSVIPLEDREISALASAGMMMPDPYHLLLQSDPDLRLRMAESNARHRVQYTSMMVPPVNVDELLKEDAKPVRIGSKEYIRGERSMADLMIAVRSSSKVLSSFRVAYAEQYALHEELLRLVQERQMVSRMRRSLAPGYLIDFVRMLESIGCKRNHLRLVNSRVVRLIRDALKLNEGDADEGLDNEAERLQRWLDEDEALSLDGGLSDDDAMGDDDEFDRLSRIAAKALMLGDLDGSRSAFADLEAYDASLEDGFGASVVGELDADASADDDAEVEAFVLADAGGMASDMVEAVPGEIEDFVYNASLDVLKVAFVDTDEQGSSAARALTEEGDGEVQLSADGRMELVSGDGLKVSGKRSGGKPASSIGASDSKSISSGSPSSSPLAISPATPSSAPSTTPSRTPSSIPALSNDGVDDGIGDAGSVSSDKVTAIPSLGKSTIAEPVSASIPKPVAALAADRVAAPMSAPVSIPPVRPSGPPKYLTGWGVEVPKGIDFGRVTGVGRLAGGDAFGGIVSTASSTPDVIPMWERNDRQASTGDRLTLDDWYRFEVPFGPYALVQMPRKLPDYIPVSEEMFPPFIDLDRYGMAAGFSAAEMRGLKIAGGGRGAIDVAIRAVRTVLIMNYGKDDEDLLRFWLFLLLGRQFMRRIDVLFPHGYFHGVAAPDPAAKEVGTGFFRLVRVLDDGNLSDQMRTPKFAPFNVRD